MLFTVNITSARKEEGIARACARYNADQLAATPFLLDADNQPTTFKDFTPLTPAEYIDFVVNMAALSYANQYKAP